MISFIVWLLLLIPAFILGKKIERNGNGVAYLLVSLWTLICIVGPRL